jgi:hypothetical protein
MTPSTTGLEQTRYQGGRDDDPLVFGREGTTFFVGGEGTDWLSGWEGTDTCVNGEQLFNCEP